FGYVAAQVDVVSGGGYGILARLGHGQQRAWFGIALAEQQEFVGQRPRQDHQVGLYAARGQPSGGSGMLAPPNQCAAAGSFWGKRLADVDLIHGSSIPVLIQLLDCSLSYSPCPIVSSHARR